jgi:hypothetical protein
MLSHLTSAKSPLREAKHRRVHLRKEVKRREKLAPKEALSRHAVWKANRNRTSLDIVHVPIEIWLSRIRFTLFKV